MKIEIDSHGTSTLKYALAESCAQIVHHAVTDMQARAIRPGKRTQQPLYLAQDILEVRRLIQSMKSYHDRRDFVATVGYVFRRLRVASGTEPRTRDLIARLHVKEAA